MKRKPKLKIVTSRLAKAEKLLAALTAVRDAVAVGLAGSLAARLQRGESMPDLRLLLALLERRVAFLARRVEICQDLLSEWHVCERFYAADRDDALSRLQPRLGQLRSLAKCMFGLSGPGLLGFTGAIPRDPRKLLKMARRVVARLQDPGLVLPAPIAPFREVDLMPLTMELETDAIALEDALDERARAHERGRNAQTVRDGALRAFDAAFEGTVSTAEWLCVLAGRPELAGRVRPAKR